MSDRIVIIRANSIVDIVDARATEQNLVEAFLGIDSGVKQTMQVAASLNACLLEAMGILSFVMVLISLLRA